MLTVCSFRTPSRSLTPDNAAAPSQYHTRVGYHMNASGSEVLTVLMEMRTHNCTIICVGVDGQMAWTIIFHFDLHRLFFDIRMIPIGFLPP